MASPKLDDFALQTVLGRGGYGKVMLVRHKTNGQVFAMKTMKKADVIKRNQREHTTSERHVLETVSHPFIVNLHYAFQTPTKLYMVLEYCPGGELFFHLSRAGRFSENRCKFYASELTLAIGYLHSLNIIYRDLKPENILVDANGHAKITDFGLSKEGIIDNISAKTTCGTPEYLAPEVLRKDGHGRGVDWYSLGALIFEMLTGLPPYYTKDREKLFRRIREGNLEYPAYVLPPAKACMQAMLHLDPNKRLGGGPTDVEEVKTHPFFGDVDWRAVLECRIPPPFKPTISSSGDVKYFEKEFVNQNVCDSEAGGRTPADGHFEGFTFAGNKK
jgi:protein-serine/threonine kinase